MNLTEMRRKPHLSVSTINQYIDCGLAYRFSKVDRAHPESTSDALVFGSCIHMALADYYAALAKGKMLQVDKLMAVFEQRWKMAVKADQITFKVGGTSESMLEQGKALLKVFHEQVPMEKSQVIGVEQPFSFHLEGLPVPIIGVFDLVLEDSSGVITIVDHKTCAKAYGDREIDDSFQLTVYHMAAKAAGHDDSEILLRFDCLIKSKTPHFIQYYTSRSSEDFERARRKIMAVLDGIQKGVFIPNDTSWRCKGCGYARRCKDWFSGKVE